MTGGLCDMYVNVALNLVKLLVIVRLHYERAARAARAAAGRGLRARYERSLAASVECSRARGDARAAGAALFPKMHVNAYT
ncbi:unnamed protein product, partial [Brenthis ino]